MLPRSASATTATAPGWPLAVRRVPSMGSTATSTSGSRPLPIASPKYSIGASSFSPSPMTTVPFMSTDPRAERMASTARWSASFSFPRPCSGAAASAAASVTRRSSSARFRSRGGCDILRRRLPETAAPDRELVGVDQQVVLVGEAPVPVQGHVHARALQQGGDGHDLAPNGGLEALDEDLVLGQPHLAERFGHDGTSSPA